MQDIIFIVLGVIHSLKYIDVIERPSINHYKNCFIMWGSIYLYDWFEYTVDHDVFQDCILTYIIGCLKGQK